MGRHRILIVDDDPDVHRVLEAILVPRYAVAHASRPEECLRALETEDPSAILLDEIGDLPKESQVKLLKVVDEGTFRRIGGEEDLSTDTRGAGRA